jgi:hypothetical protein
VIAGPPGGLYDGRVRRISRPIASRTVRVIAPAEASRCSVTSPNVLGPTTFVGVWFPVSTPARQTDRAGSTVRSIWPVRS